MNLISTGGLGDAFIAGLKINEKVEAGMQLESWLHVESMDMGHQAERVASLFPRLHKKFSFEHHSDYINMVKSGTWKDRTAIPISFRRPCALHGKKLEVENPFLRMPEVEKVFDVTIQVSAGQKNNKKWIFDIVQLGQALARNYDFSICLIGNDLSLKIPEGVIEPNLHSEVGAWANVTDAAWAINKSKIFIGLSGFMNYYACANKIHNIHLIEGREQEEDYYHDKWLPLTYGIRHPTFGEVMRGINHMKGIGAL